MKQKIIRTIMRSLLIVGVLLALLKVVEADVSNIDFTNKYAWGTNVGWINFNPTLGVTVYASHLEGYAWAENVGWIRLGTYEGGGAHSYVNSSLSDYGVNNDGEGNLSGYAWSPKTGWINFNPTDGGVIAYDDHLEGHAWAENVGWIRLGTEDGGGNHRYGNSSNSDYGVNKDPAGHLAGYAWGSNVGWINFGSIESGGVTVYPDHLEGYAWGENVGWIRMGTNTDGGTHSYGNSSNTDYGVNRDCDTDALNGSAWGTNVGWINFNASDPTDNGVMVDAETGEFDGYAWAENIGWLRFKNTSGTPYSVQFVTNTLTIEGSSPQSYSVGCGATKVTVNVTDTGSCLTALTINRTGTNPPNAPAGIADGQYWEITPTGCTTGFTVDLTFPHTNNITAANARACRYDSGTSSWDCDDAGDNTTSDGSYVTRTAVTEFSTWAVGDASIPTEEASISDLRLTNVRDGSLTTSWITDVESTGELRYGTDPNNLNQTGYDSRGAATSDDTHYVTLTALDPNSTYYFDLVSGGMTDDNNGTHYSVTTGATLDLPASDAQYGQVNKSDGTTAASGTMVYITLEEANGVGSPGQSAPISALVDNSGYWVTNLGNARTADLSQYFSYSNGDLLHLSAQGAADGVACEIEVEIGDTIPERVLTDSCWEMNIEPGWNHISLPLEPVTAYSAESVCDEINNQGGSAVEIDRWYNSGWDSHICDLPFNEFPLVLGSDYFIKSNSASTWTIEGVEVSVPVPLTLQVGWNSIGIPHTDAYTAESLCDDIINQGVTAIEIDRWYNGGWDGHICGLSFNDFNIERGTGYFVKTSSSGTIIPSEAASSPLQQAHIRLSLSPDRVPTGKTLPVRDWHVGNLRNSSVSLSWVTDDATTGYVTFGSAGERVAYDSRGAEMSSTTHLVLLKQLAPESTYHFEIISGQEVVERGSFTTAPSMESVPESDTVYGRVYQADGQTPAAGSIVYLTLRDADGEGSTGEAALLLATVDASGYWQANLGNARSRDLSDSFNYSASGDELLIEVEGVGRASQSVDTANDAQAPKMILSDSNDPSSITVAAFENNSSSIPWQGLLLAPLAFTILALYIRRRR